MFSSMRRRTSRESLISPIAQPIGAAGDSERGTVRRLRSISRLQQPRVSLPHISPLLVTRVATVHVRQKTLSWRSWSRQVLKLTKHTISLHRDIESDVIGLIVLRRVRSVERVTAESLCLKVETSDDKAFYFIFSSEEELYSWLTDIHQGTSHYSDPTNFTHVLHVERDKTDKQRFIGLPEDWQQAANSIIARENVVREMIELPEISFTDSPDLIINFDELSNSRPTTPDSQLEDEGEAVILKAQTATRAVTQRLLILQPSSLKIVTQGCSSQSLSPSSLPSASEGFLSTPLLTPDTSPLTPFRESPYRYRESDAQDLSGQVHKQSDWPNEYGGNADIWRARWDYDLGVSLQVAVKVLRVLNQDENIKAKIRKRLCKEVRVWHQLRHKNVVQMFGTCDGFGPFPSMVSEWYENGNVNTYLRTLGDAGTLERRMKLLTDVARGLNYLHTFDFPVPHDSTAGANIVHGDVKGDNILVNRFGEAALADFGLSSIIAVAGENSTSTFSGGSMRWMAPELFKSQNIKAKTCASDTYSYGSVILEIMTGEHPYIDIPDMQVITQLLEGVTPKRPRMPILNPGVWDLMERCWNATPSDRPKMAFVLSRMEKFYDERMKNAPLPIIRGREIDL